MPTKAKAKAVLLQDFGYDNFSTDDEAPTPRLVIANVGNDYYSKRAFMHAHSPLQESFDSVSQDVPKRPSTAGSTASRDRKLSVFSRPLTSYECEIRKRDSRPGTASGPPRAGSCPGGSQQVGGIGVALGSPTGVESDDATLDHMVQRPLYTTRNSSSRTLQTMQSMPMHPQSEQSAKPKRWKSVSNLFSRKKSASSKTSQSATSQLQTAHFESMPDLAQESEKEQKKGRSRSGSRSSITLRRSKQKTADMPPLPVMPALPPPSRPAPDRPGLSHSQTAPAIVETPMHMCVGEKISTTQARQEETIMKQAETPNTSNAPVRKRDSRPQLDVEIPQTRFERFSVMFSDLQGLSNTTKAQARTSLLMRRNRASKLVPLETLMQEAPEPETQPIERVAEPMRPQTAPAPEPAPSESVADVPLIAPTPRRAASTKSINKGPAYSLFPKTSSKTPRPSISIPDTNLHPLNAHPTLRSRSSTATGYIVSPPPTCPPPAVPTVLKREVSNDIVEMLDFLESASETASPPRNKALPNPLKSHSTPQSAPPDFSFKASSHTATPPESPVLRPLPHMTPLSSKSTPHQTQASPALRSSSVHQQSITLPPSPTSSSSSGASSPVGTAPSTAGTAPSDHEIYHTPQMSCSTSSSHHVEQSSERPRATSLRRGGRDVAIVAPNVYVLNPPLAHSPANSRSISSSAVKAATSSSPSDLLTEPSIIPPKRTSSLIPNTNPFRRSPNMPSGDSSASTLSHLAALTTHPLHTSSLSPSTAADGETALSASTLSPAPSSAQTPSLVYGYDAEHSPLLATAQTMQVVVGSSKPLPTTSNSTSTLGPAPSFTTCPDLAPSPRVNPSANLRSESKSPQQQRSKIPLPTLTAGNPIRVHTQKYAARTYLDEDSDIEPHIDYSTSDDEHGYSDDELDDVVGQERTSNESLNIVRARTPTIIEVDGGEGKGVIGLGLGLGLGMGGIGAGSRSPDFALGKSSGSLQRGRSVEGLLEVA